MERQFGDVYFETSYFEDQNEGCAGVRLHRTRAGAQPIVAAEVVFWDASGQFFVETFNTDVPLEILERLIAEARERIDGG
ncbi:MAG: hypothetical protein DWQ34_28320 [Planctomycetota bacterium]|nr:MAG: hypothetical protein DWQ34_28320 [Planctomycetota bacterium]REJ90141.1 MAG: hypothetical protein DWQ29_06985 [Planctomycetota bacterium]REK30713.1 MAG: hypothetical protein DWQ41_01830 [Planctomycetota bacterium]REK33088.1 MAG: hypothetical protein DWQ45_15935 [Planctomycetota bacterium]